MIILFQDADVGEVQCKEELLLDDTKDFLGFPDINVAPPDNPIGTIAKKRKKRNSPIGEATYIFGDTSGHDEFHFFAMAIAAQLRNMPLENALECETKIHAIVKQERLSILRNA